MNKSYIILFLYILLHSSCTPDKQTETLFLQAESLIEEYPDSTLQLLHSLPKLQDLSQKECARYALLLARATDKTEKPLLPCDSLLNVALQYYDKDDKERAVGLLYKGRLEEEMNNPENAIAYLQEGLSILSNFPEEIETRRLILSSLGNLYFNARYYEESFKMCTELYDCCMTDKDKSIALNGISAYYCMTEAEDSTIITQRKAIEYAFSSKDSVQIAASILGLSLSFNDFDKNDSALYYAQKALVYAPQKEPKGRYYNYLGSLLLETKISRDSIIFCINKSMEDLSFTGRYTALLTLSDLEKEKGNFKAAHHYLEEYIANMDSIVAAEKATEIQQLIYDYKTDKQIKKEKRKGRRQMQSAITCFILGCSFLIIYYQYRINKKKKSQLIYQQTLNKTQSKLFSMQKKMEESQHIISLLRKEHDSLMQEKEDRSKEIEEKESIIEKLSIEKQALRNWLFTQSDIYKKIVTLSKQKASDKKEMKVMTNSELKKLKETIFEIYADYTMQMQEQYPKLVEDDLLFLCLQEAQVNSQTIALCFGYHDTHTINQRKYRIKERMNRANM